jgi:hypothetical protein
MKIYYMLPLLFTTACASIVTGQQQSLSVTTTPSPANCSLVNDKGTWYVTTPGTVTIKRAYGDMSVICKKDKLSAQKIVKSSTKGIVAGNILLGGIIGGAVDMGTGAAYEYQNPIELPLM